MNYVKPKIEILNLALDKAMASGGLGGWLEEQQFDTNTEDHITTYEVNS